MDVPVPVPDPVADLVSEALEMPFPMLLNPFGSCWSGLGVKLGRRRDDSCVVSKHGDIDE